jgi:hypothetical protein
MLMQQIFLVSYNDFDIEKPKNIIKSTCLLVFQALFATTTVGSHMTPEAQARQVIDQKLEQAGWIIQDMKQLKLGAGPGVAVREYPTDSGPADYVLFVGRNAVGY